MSTVYCIRLRGDKVYHNKIAPKGKQFRIFEIVIKPADFSVNEEVKVIPRLVDPQTAVYDILDTNLIAFSKITGSADVIAKFDYQPHGYKTKYLAAWKQSSTNNWTITIYFDLVPLSRIEAIWEYIAKRR